MSLSASRAVSPESGPGAVRALHVVVPARDEERMLPGCLAAIRVSVLDVLASRPGLAVRVTVVLDRCQDASPVIARAAGVHCLELPAGGVDGGVGVARAAGVASTSGWLRALPGPVHPGRVWVSTTDADSRVPPQWLAEHLDLAERGHGLVLGPVRPDPVGLPAPVLRAWEQAHPRDSPAVFGANLGFRLDGYERVGGFEAVAEHEDVRLVEALRAAGVSHARSSRPVLTSARTTGRTPGGFAGYLRGLSEALPEAALPGAARVEPV